MLVYSCYVDKNFEKIGILRKFLLDNISIYQEEKFEYGNNKILFDNGKSKKVWEWDELIGQFYKKMLIYYNTNYDFFYLKNVINEVCTFKYDILFAGSSYARFGIEEKMLKRKGKNLSLSSQDIYYSCKLLKRLIDSNAEICDVVIGGSYYQFFCDLSSCSGGELGRVSNVYYPILKDMHNAIFLPDPIEGSGGVSEVFNISVIMDMLARSIYDKSGRSYFTKERNRFTQKMCFWNDPDISWENISKEEKAICAKARAEQHNELIKYYNTYEENIYILNKFCKYAYQKGVNVWMIAFPMTDYYKQELDLRYKDSYYQALERLDNEIHLIDFNDMDIFLDSDFNDMDHLNYSGAVKITNILNTIL